MKETSSSLPRNDVADQVGRPPIGLDPNLTGASAAQRQTYDLIQTGPRGSVPSPFLAMLDAPTLAEAIQSVGVVIRFEGSLEASVRELAILTTAAAVGCGYEWGHHAPIAERAGLPRDAILASRTSQTFERLDARWASVIRFCRMVVAERRVDPDLLADIVQRFGRDGATELIAIAGYYALLASFIIIGGHDVAMDEPEAF